MVAWRRLIFPDGMALELLNMGGVDEGGYAGFNDQVNNHYFRTYANAFLMSLVVGSASYAVDSLEGSKTDANGNEKTTLSNEMSKAMATQMMGAVSIGVAMDLDVVYLESCTHEQGTLKRPAVGAVRGIVETAMGRALLASLEEGARMETLERIRNQRPDDHQRCLAGVEDSLTHYRKRGFAINLGDAGLGVLAVGVASRIRYGSRQLLFNCAVPGYRVKPQELLKTIGPRLTDMVRMADAQSGVR